MYQHVKIPAAGQKMSMHHVRVVGPDLVCASELVIAGIRPGDIDGVPPKRYRADPIERGWLMQTHVGIRVDPVSARGVTAIDDRDRRSGVLEQRVGKCHPRSSRTDDEIVRFDVFVQHWVMPVVAGRVTTNDIALSGELRASTGTTGQAASARTV